MSIDWKKIEEWNKKYILKALVEEKEYHTTCIERTEGDYLITPDGTRLLDFFNQLYCVNAGQNVPEIQEAIREATDRYGFLWDIYTTDYKAETAKILIEDILGKYDWAEKVRFTLGGGDSVEVATGIARLVTGKPIIATREYAYHGGYGGSSNLTRVYSGRSHASYDNSNEVRQTPGFSYQNTCLCPAPFCYRCSLGHNYPDCKSVYPDGTLPCVKQTEYILLNTGIDQIAALITEPANGAGTIMPPPEYITQIYEMKKRLGIIWIVDEVMMGFGRLGAWMGHQHYDPKVKPDIITTAKGLTSSALPLGAVILNKEISDFMANIRWNHVSTFSGHPLPIAAAKANLEYMIKNDVPGQCAKAGEHFGAELNNLMEKHKSVGLVAGAGMFWQVELVKNRETREPFIKDDRNTSFSGDLSKFPINIVAGKAAEKNVLIGGFVPNTLRMGASCVVSKADIDKAIDALDHGFTELDKFAD